MVGYSKLCVKLFKKTNRSCFVSARRSGVAEFFPHPLPSHHRFKSHAIQANETGTPQIDLF